MHQRTDADRFNAHQHDHSEERDRDEGAGETARTDIRTEQHHGSTVAQPRGLALQRTDCRQSRSFLRPSYPVIFPSQFCCYVTKVPAIRLLTPELKANLHTVMKLREVKQGFQMAGHLLR
jgi:hypothetical protein